MPGAGVLPGMIAINAQHLAHHKWIAIGSIILLLIGIEECLRMMWEIHKWEKEWKKKSK